MRVIRQSYIVHAPSVKVWQALTDPKIIARWGAGPAVMSDKIGGRFKLWGGEVWGKNLEVKKNRQLVQEWHTGKGDKVSIVTISLTYENKRTYIDMLHEDVPEEKRDKLNKGWKEHYFNPMKKYLESQFPDHNS